MKQKKSIGCKVIPTSSNGGTLSLKKDVWDTHIQKKKKSTLKRPKSHFNINYDALI